MIRIIYISVYSQLEEITRRLEARFGRVFKEKQGAYTLMVFSHEDTDVVVCLRENNGVLIAKTILERDLMTLNCREAEYSPRGLYVFSRDPSEFVEKIIDKIKRL